MTSLPFFIWLDRSRNARAIIHRGIDTIIALIIVVCFYKYNSCVLLMQLFFLTSECGLHTFVLFSHFSVWLAVKCGN
jgi:hypothetical protein